MTDYRRPEDHGHRIAAARDVAQWEIGDPSWANTIIAAYENPQDAWVLEIRDQVTPKVGREA
jgi:hypothetical protein